MPKRTTFHPKISEISEFKPTLVTVIIPADQHDALKNLLLSTGELYVARAIEAILKELAYAEDGESSMAARREKALNFLRDYEKVVTESFREAINNGASKAAQRVTELVIERGMD